MSIQPNFTIEKANNLEYGITTSNNSSFSVALSDNLQYTISITPDYDLRPTSDGLWNSVSDLWDDSIALWNAT